MRHFLTALTDAQMLADNALKYPHYRFDAVDAYMGKGAERNKSFVNFWESEASPTFVVGHCVVQNLLTVS